jgi:transcriptional regulator with GAF, ATPase, and Fis domain
MLVVSGPLQGRGYPLRGSSCSIGRQKDRDIQVLDLAVSRCHCQLERAPIEDPGAMPVASASAEAAAGAWRIRDLESRCGTFVNGEPVRERVLVHGDVVQVASTTFLFLLHDGGEAEAPADSHLLVQSTIQKRLEEHPLLLDASAALPSAEQERGALLQLCTAVQAARDVEALSAALLDHLMKWLPIDRCCVLVAGAGASERPSPAELEIVAARGPDAAAGAPTVSRAVLGRALAEPVALLCSDVSADPALAAAESLEAVRVRALLCVPLASRDRVLGAIYVESSRRHELVERHLDLALAAAAIAQLALANLAQLGWLRRENQRLRGQGAAARLMVGESPAMKRLHALIHRVGATSSTVLIRGESGTGKELCAHAVHSASARAEGPFVAINCATLSETLLESELFGHEKGAFTGAVARKIGKVELAHGGTLFLDEIGELPLALQARLLRVLQEREIDRVGGTKPIAVDVRIVAATNRDLEGVMRAGRFREDLFYRLNVVALSTPSLRDRREDISLLARHFARIYGDRAGRLVVGISDAARAALVAYDWPGNVRQLGNVIERALVLGSDETIQLEDLPDEVLAVRAPAAGGEGRAGAENETFHDLILATKRRLILEAYERAGDDHQRAAALLGVHANSLHRLIRTLGLKSELGKERV